MNRILSIIAVAIVCCCVLSCNEKPKSYRFVQVNKDGSEKVEEIEAKNDTDALNKYFVRLEKVIIANLDKKESAIEAMYVISPAGDTLNKNEELLQSVMKNVPVMATPTPAAPGTEVEQPAKKG